MLSKLSETPLGGRSGGRPHLVLMWENVLGLSIKDTYINIYIKMPQFH